MSIEEEIYSKLVEQFGIGETCIKKWGKRKEVTWIAFIYLVVVKDMVGSMLAKSLGLNDASALVGYLLREFPQVCKSKGVRTQWSPYLLSIIQHKKCCNCSNIYPYSHYNNSGTIRYGKQSQCKTCSIEYMAGSKHIYRAAKARYRASKLQATPKWADLEAIKEIYKNCPVGYHVDHIVPLQGKLVCGLHVHENLKPIPAEENLAKSNKFEII